MSVDYAKLKTNLNLIMHRLKLVEKKKMELNQKARRTIGEFLNAGKVDRARIRVEQIIREDYLIEAMDLIESYCDFILSRLGQLQSTDVVDEGLATPVSSIIWVTPRLESDVPELKVIADQLSRKYGKQYVSAVLDNSMKTVNDTLMKKMGTQAPPKVLVEKYLVEIAKDQKIDYKADPRILKEHEASGYRPGSSDDDDDNSGQRRRDHAPASGFNLIDLGDHYPRNPITQPFNPYGQAPPLPSEPPLGPTPVGPSGSISEASNASAPSARIPIGFNLRDLDTSSGSQSNSSQSTQIEKSTSSKQANEPPGSNLLPNSEGPPPNYDSVVNKPGNATQYYSFGPDSSFAAQRRPDDDLNDTLPELPPVPKDVPDAPPSAPSGSLDFEDLTRRFEDLKNKKN